MDERHHSAFTGARATVDPWVGGRLTAKDGYINATHIRLETGTRIVMTWRTSDFPIEMPDSQVDVELEAVAGGTRINILHEGIPQGQGSRYRDLWRAQYLDPMKRFFSKPQAARAALRAASKAGLLPTPSLTNTRPAGRVPIGPAPTLGNPDRIAAARPERRASEKAAPARKPSTKPPAKAKPAKKKPVATAPKKKPAVKAKKTAPRSSAAARSKPRGKVAARGRRR